MVIGVHTAFLSGFTGRSGIGQYTARLEMGVPVFFVISGFLLYRPFAVAHFRDGTNPSIRSFWLRRMKRILPAYWTAFIVITFVLRADTIRHGLGSMVIYLGFGQIYFPHYVLSGLTQAWSLCTEMSFYLAVPLWAMLMIRKPRTRRDQLRVELLGLVALTATSFLFRTVVLLNAHSPLARTMPNWLPAYADLFSLGMLLAILSAYYAAEDRRPASLWNPVMPWASWTLALLAYWAVSNLSLPVAPGQGTTLGPSLARQTLYGLFGFFVVAPAVFGPQERSVIRRALQWKPIALVGVVSYGVYLWHQAWAHMVMTWAGTNTFQIGFMLLASTVTALAIMSATASYVLVERPVRLAGRKRRVSVKQPVRPPQAIAAQVGAGR